MRTLIVLATLVALAAIPSASAAGDIVFTSDVNTAVPGTFLLSSDGGNGDLVRLPAGVGVVWTQAQALAAPANAAGTFEYDFYFSKARSVQIDYGYMLAGVFHSLGSSGAVPVTDNARTVLGQPLRLNDPVLFVGHTSGSFPVAGEFPAGAVPAVEITAVGGDNTFYPQPSLLGAPQSSSASTVPLPELPAMVLTGLGLATIGGVALVRARRA